LIAIGWLADPAWWTVDQAQATTTPKGDLPMSNALHGPKAAPPLLRHLPQHPLRRAVRLATAAACLAALPLAAHAARECEQPGHVPATGACAHLPQADLYYTDTGRHADGLGETVVLLHAASGNADAFRDNIAALHGAGYRVIAYDRKNWGRSSNTLHDDALGRERGTAAQDLDHLADALGVQRFHLVGVAAGGQLALQYAASRPQRVQSLVLAATLGPPGLAANEPTLAALHEAIAVPLEIFCPGPIANPPPAPLRLINPGTQPSVNVPRQLVEHKELGTRFRATNPAGVASFRSINENARHRSSDGCRTTFIGSNQPMLAPGDPLSPNTLARIGALVRARTLLVAGTGDVFYSPPVQMQLWGSAIRDVQYTQLDTGHAPQLEDPAGFNAALRGFLDGSRTFERLPTTR
jgi:pimeloyl-ACP methyl ester carboxylesterase